VSIAAAGRAPSNSEKSKAVKNILQRSKEYSPAVSGLRLFGMAISIKNKQLGFGTGHEHHHVMNQRFRGVQ
jgi:hypothetical protein